MSKMNTVIDEGRGETPFTVNFHGNAGQSKIAIKFDEEHLCSAVGVGNPGMMGLHGLTVDKVDSSLRGLVSGLSVFEVSLIVNVCVVWLNVCIWTHFLYFGRILGKGLELDD